MRIVEAVLRRHPVLTYFGLTFVTSWVGVLLIIGGPAGMTGVKAQDNPLFPLAVLAMLAGPSVTGILLTGLIDGKQGLRKFRSRLLRWRVGGRWYAIALLAAPLMATATTLSGSPNGRFAGGCSVRAWRSITRAARSRGASSACPSIAAARSTDVVALVSDMVQMTGRRAVMAVDSPAVAPVSTSR